MVNVEEGSVGNEQVIQQGFTQEGSVSVGECIVNAAIEVPEVIQVQDALPEGADNPRSRGVRHLQEHVAIGGCAICKKTNLSKSSFVDGMTMLVCDQCGREFHVACLRDSGVEDLSELPEDEWFCQRDCQGIDAVLTQLVANGPESLSDSSINELLESRRGKEKGESGSNFEWQILCGKAGRPANHKTLAEAMHLFAECLDPITDPKTGRNLTPLMVYSKRSKDHDFEGLFCVVLKFNKKVVSAALLQLFGRDIAEVPLAATSRPFQGQGLCRALMTTIERLLGVLDVKSLVLPAPIGSEAIWINKFGFKPLEDQQVAKICSAIRLWTFTDSRMLHKPIATLTVGNH